MFSTSLRLLNDVLDPIGSEIPYNVYYKFIQEIMPSLSIESEPLLFSSKALFGSNILKDSNISLKYMNAVKKR